MGVCRRFLLPNFNSTIEEIKNTSNLEVVELGDTQINRHNGFNKIEIYPPTRFRNLYKHLFKTWRTLDLHGPRDVEHCDLSFISNKKNCADIIINYGTSEHVEFEEGQYNCWLNIHNFLRINGISINALPLAGEWPKHCRWYYTADFFNNFKNYGYKILHMEITWHKLIFCKLLKTQDGNFMSYKDFMNKIVFKNMNYKDASIHNNPKKLKW